MNKQAVNYENLRAILECELGRDVSLDEATETGKYLLRIYEILLDNGGLKC